MKPYHEYTNWMLREYFAREGEFVLDEKEPDNQFVLRVTAKAKEIARTKAEEVNLIICAVSLRTLPVTQVNILREVFGENEQSTGDAVRICARRKNLKEKVVWNTVRSVSQEIARTRGLI